MQMYLILRATVRVALHLYCGRIRVRQAEALPRHGVLLLASNHPNSFFDALIIATHLDRRMYFLTRGDVFRKPRIARLLLAMNMIPIHRMSEGRSELHLTEGSFLRSNDILREGSSILIFSEGLSVNENGLRPLGKGTARIAFRAWYGSEPIELVVVPIWLRYDTFHRPFMDVTLATGALMRALNEAPNSEPNFLRSFNKKLERDLVATGEFADRSIGPFQEPARRSLIGNVIVGTLTVIALLLHAPWYFALRAYTAKKTNGTVFFDSVLFGLLYLTYPIWLMVLVLVTKLLGGSWLEALIVALNAPLWVYALRRSRNYFTSLRPKGGSAKVDPESHQ